MRNPVNGRGIVLTRQMLGDRKRTETPTSKHGAENGTGAQSVGKFTEKWSEA